jgi:hypothetical protein
MASYTTVVRVVDEGTGLPLPGLRVTLLDSDRFSGDDRLGSGTTDDAGEARFEYTTAHFADLEDRMSGSLPDLYCVIHAADGGEIFTNRAETLDNTPRRRIDVALPAELVARHGLASARG